MPIVQSLFVTTGPRAGSVLVPKKDAATPLGPDPLGVAEWGILLVGAPGASSNDGRVYLFDGGDF